MWVWSRANLVAATLPVSAGGIGIRSTVQLAPSAYLASATGSAKLVHLSPPPSPTYKTLPTLV